MPVLFIILGFISLLLIDNAESGSANGQGTPWEQFLGVLAVPVFASALIDLIRSYIFWNRAEHVVTRSSSNWEVRPHGDPIPSTW